MTFNCIYVRDNGRTNYADLLVKGYKKIETRRLDSLSTVVDTTVGVIRIDRKGRKTLVGFIKFGKAYHYKDYEDFRSEYDLHLVPKGSKYDFQDRKVGYLVYYHYWFQPIPLEQNQITQVIPRRVCEIDIDL